MYVRSQALARSRECKRLGLWGGNCTVLENYRRLLLLPVQKETVREDKPAYCGNIFSAVNVLLYMKMF